MSRSPYFFALAAVLLCGCLPGPSRTSPYPADRWEVATPASVGLESRALAETLKNVQENGWRVDSIQVVRHGKLVLDAYFYPYSPGHPHDLRSVTKSVTSSLLGLSIAQGKWSGLDVPVLSQFPARRIEAVDARKQAMTLGNLVDMRSGMAWTEYPYNEQSSFYLMEQSRDWVGFILNQPMVAAPGSRFNYSGANMNLLAAMIGQAWSLPAREVARTQLFEPIGITQYDWNGADPDGNTVGQSTLYLLPTDMARLGLLWLHDGVWRDRRILPAGWTGQVPATALPAEDDGDFYKRGFWVNQARTRYAALGRHGQAILVDPALDMVIVITGKSADNENTHLSQVAEMIRHGIGAAPRLPPDPAAQAALAAMVRQVARPPVRQPGLVGPGASQYGKTWPLGRNRFGITSLHLSAAPGDPGAMFLELGTKSSRVARYPCGLDGCFRFSPNDENHDQVLALKGRWLSPMLLEMEGQYPDSGDSTYLIIRLEFKGEDLVIRFQDNQYFSGTIHSMAKEDR